MCDLKTKFDFLSHDRDDSVEIIPKYQHFTDFKYSLCIRNFNRGIKDEFCGIYSM